MRFRLLLILTLGLCAIGTLVVCVRTKQTLLSRYTALASPVMTDRHGQIIRITPNSRGNLAQFFTNPIPPQIEQLVLLQEDQQFYRHLGVNPWSLVRALSHRVLRNGNPGSSTITQQLVKILNGNENKRSPGNKIKETLAAVALELTTSKEEILSMYLNVVYLGNNVQGIALGSQLYGGTTPERLSDVDAARLIASIPSPSDMYPFSELNVVPATALLQAYDREQELLPLSTFVIEERRAAFRNLTAAPTAFELASLDLSCTHECQMTVDRTLSESIRGITKRHLATLSNEHAEHAAVVVLKLPENELLAMVGSPDPTSDRDGYQINMAFSPRAIGSTLKPLFYLKAFEKGLRPYTLADDREYRYTIGTGFSLYPKNYDYTYHGIVSLRSALANSFNVPAIKVLEYVGVDAFADFMTRELHFETTQPFASYELGIALGTVETHLLELSRALSILPNKGQLSPIRFLTNDTATSTSVADPRAVALINSILSDRAAASDEFGQASSLNLQAGNYALKTGTSREYHDSWTVGYTPDFLVGVWVGNSNNTPMDAISGQRGAGLIWHDVMEVMFNSPYNKKTPFDETGLKKITVNGSEYYGLPGDDVEKIEQLLLERSATLITSPHHGDSLLLEPDTKIPLTATKSVTWTINDVKLTTAHSTVFVPKQTGSYTITAKTLDGTTETVKIVIQ